MIHSATKAALLVLSVFLLHSPIIGDTIGERILVGYTPKIPSENIFKLIETHHIAGIFYVGHVPFTPKEALTFHQDLHAHAKKSGYKKPLIIAIDQEGGVVQRFRNGFTRLPYFNEIGLKNEPEVAETYGYLIGKELSAVGVNMLLGPVMDVNSNPKNPVIGTRSLGPVPKRVAILGSAFIKGVKRGGVVPVAKHFPGHGDTTLDSHTHSPVVHKTFNMMQETEFLPFKSAIQNGVPAIMTNHVVYPKLFQPLTPPSINDGYARMLRDYFRFRGVIMTDDMQMAAVATRVSPRNRLIVPLLNGHDLVLSSQSPAQTQKVLDNIGKDPLSTLLSTHLATNRSTLYFLRSRLQIPPKRLKTSHINSEKLKRLIAELKESK
jgi:beta-N-acetylhexosaminidase